MSNPRNESRDEACFALLHAYLEELHAGLRPDRNKLLSQYPELEATLNCLDAIDSLAPMIPVEAPSHDKPHSAPTLAAPVANILDKPLEPTAAPLSDFGDYELISEIGRGGMGVVYKARQKSLDRLVAVKMILASHLASNEQVERFYAEAKAAAKLKHPNIVGIHEVGQRHGQHYFVMEHVEGRSLSQKLEGGPLEPDQCAAYVAKIARAVHQLHREGIIHRDLKPSNILIDGHGEPHVTDFGLAKTLLGDSHMTHSGTIVGTPSYMSPEQAAGRAANVGPASDVYSLGAVLYDLLTGRPPFREGTPLDTLVQVLEADPRLPSQLNPRVPRDLEMICLRCLEKNPEARYESAEELADDLERFLNNESVDAQPPNWWLRVRRWSRREPALATRLTVLAVCVIILQINYALTHGTAEQVEPQVHVQVLCGLGVWAAASLVFQRLMNQERHSEWVRYAWAATDAVLLTLVLWLTDTVQSPVIVGFPALIATSGLWFRQRLVWFMTAICFCAYAVLLVDWRMRGENLEEPLFRHVILLVVLVGLGFVVAYQVRRIRALSRYYEHRRLP